MGTYVGVLEETGTIDIVDVSPFSTNGALVLANAPESVDKDRFFRQLVAYGALVVALAPVVLWLVFVVALG